MKSIAHVHTVLQCVTLSDRKYHLLPPRKEFLGKVIFSYSCVILSKFCPPSPETRQIHPPPGPSRYTTRGEHIPPYGKRASGTHPNGMHSGIHVCILYLKFLYMYIWPNTGLTMYVCTYPPTSID